jgi:hypothetical protein
MADSGDVVGTGNGTRATFTGHEEGNLGYTPRRSLRAIAPALDPTHCGGFRRVVGSGDSKTRSNQWESRIFSRAGELNRHNSPRVDVLRVH